MPHEKLPFNVEPLEAARQRIGPPVQFNGSDTVSKHFADKVESTRRDLNDLFWQGRHVKDSATVVVRPVAAGAAYWHLQIPGTCPSEGRSRQVMALRGIAKQSTGSSKTA